MESTKAIEYILGRLRNELPDNLRYHAYGHSLEVIESAEEIAQAEQITGEKLELLLTAVAFHDSGFIISYENHEENGCRLAQEALPGYGYSADQIEYIQQLIMATKVPQNAQSHLGQIICDADLDYLGREDYDEISSGLREELVLNGRDIDEATWLDIQINFLEEHHYWTEHSENKRGGGKRLQLARLKSRRDKLDH